MKIACVQCHVSFNDPLANAERLVEHLHKLAAQGVQVALFPEAFLTGYCVDSCSQALEIAIPRDHESVQRISATAKDLEMVVIVGFAERAGDDVYNTALFADPDHEPRFYRKTHVPELGLDKHVKLGDKLAVFDTRFGRIGVLICYDLRPPEAARVLALGGADLIALPTNWPTGAEVSANFISIARASENKVFFASCNRVGVENGVQFIGLSKIVAPSGKPLVEAGADEETIMAELDLELARNKRTINIPGEYEFDVMASRRPGLYGRILEC